MSDLPPCKPTGNLDAANEQVVLDLFRSLHADGTTLIVVTHDPAVAQEGDRTVVLDHGRIVDDLDAPTGGRVTCGGPWAG